MQEKGKGKERKCKIFYRIDTRFSLNLLDRLSTLKQRPPMAILPLGKSDRYGMM